jgi:hypothetical protein
MPKRNWADGAPGNTPLNAARLNQLEADLESALLQLARDPSQLFSGSVARDASGAAVSATVEWPDGAAGVYSGTASETFPGAVDAYTVTRTGSPTVTFTQPAVTRNAAGHVTNRPPITVS